MEILAVFKLSNGIGVVISMDENERNSFENCYRTKKMTSGFRIIDSNVVELFIEEVTFSLTREEILFLKDNPAIFILVRSPEDPRVSKHYSFSLDREVFLKMVGAIEFLGDSMKGRAGELEIIYN